MAGIKEAMKRVTEHRNEGKVVAKGVLKECDCGEEDKYSECSQTEYLIIKLKKDGGCITVYDDGSDIRIASNVEVLDDVILVITDNWSAAWRRKKDLSDSDVRFSDVKTKLHAPSRYRLSELLSELKFGRPLSSQTLLDNLIKITLEEEGNNPF